MSFGCERSCSSPRRVSILKFERDTLNIFRVKSVNVVRVYGGRGHSGGDGKTIITLRSVI